MAGSRAVKATRSVLAKDFPRIRTIRATMIEDYHKHTVPIDVRGIAVKQ